MAWSTFSEIQSFVSKFSQLSSLGLDVDVKFSSSNKKVSVNFTAELGNMIPLPQYAPYTASYKQNYTEKPSKTRRRNRRKQSFTQCAEDASINTEKLDASASSTLDDGTRNEEYPLTDHYGCDPSLFEESIKCSSSLSTSSPKNDMKIIECVHNDECSSLSFGSAATAFISKDIDSSALNVGNDYTMDVQRKKTEDSIDKIEFFSVMESIKTSLIENRKSLLDEIHLAVDAALQNDDGGESSRHSINKT